MSDEDRQQAINWIRQRLLFEAILKAFREEAEEPEAERQAA